MFKYSPPDGMSKFFIAGSVHVFVKVDLTVDEVVAVHRDHQAAISGHDSTHHEGQVIVGVPFLYSHHLAGS